MVEHIDVVLRKTMLYGWAVLFWHEVVNAGRSDM